MVEFNSCLIVTRHRTTELQDEDIDKICKEVFLTHELPSDLNELKRVINSHDAVIGSFPLYLQVQILQNSKALITFVMKSVGVTENKEDAEYLAMKYPGRSAILPPSKEGEKYRVVVYEGLKQIKEIKVVDEWVVQHSD
jgi:hypothetical protein